MTIAHVQHTGKTQDSAAAVALAYSGNVTSGNLLLIGCAKFESGGTASDFVAGDCTKSAGTATVGTIALDKTLNLSPTVGIAVGIWSVPVTGTGSCTMQVGGLANTYFALGILEVSGTFSATAATRLETSNSGSGTATTQASGNMTSAGGALFVGVTSLDTGNNETTYTEDGAFTRIFREPDGTAHAVGLIFYKIVSSGNTDSADTTTTPSLPYAAIGTVYKEISAGAAVATTAGVLSGGLNALGTGLTRAILPAGLGNTG